MNVINKSILNVIIYLCLNRREDRIFVHLCFLTSLNEEQLDVFRRFIDAGIIDSNKSHFRLVKRPHYSDNSLLDCLRMMSKSKYNERYFDGMEQSIPNLCFNYVHKDGLYEILKLLIDNGVDVKLRNLQRNTALSLLRSRNSKLASFRAVRSLLIKNGAT